MRLFIHALVLALCTCRMAAGQGSLSLQEAIDIALHHNPDLLAAGYEVEAAKAGERGARSLANPEIALAPAITGVEGSDEELSVTQPLEINGERALRARIAGAESQAVQASRRSAERQVIRSVKEAYWDAVQAQNVVELDQGNVEFLETMAQAAERQVDVGAAPGAQRIKAQVELTRARQDLLRSESELAEARASINVLMGRDAESPFEPSDQLRFAPLALDSTVRNGAGRPELAEAQALLALRKAEVREIEVQRRPDVSLQFRQTSLGGEGGAAVAITIPLLDWGSIRQSRKKAEAQVDAQKHRVEAVENAIALDVDSAVRQVRLAEALVKDYQQGVLSQAEQLAEMAQKGYKTGANSYLEVLEAQRTLRSVKSEYNAALADHAKALAQLEWAVGADLPKGEVTK